MKEIKVSFDNPDEVLEFVTQIANYPYDMDMKKGHIVIDAKSILGVLGLAVGNVVDLQIHGEPCEKLTGALEKYRVS